jgi:hypothetical protein
MKLPLCYCLSAIIMIGCSSAAPKLMTPEKEEVNSKVSASEEDCLTVYDRVLSLKLMELEAADDHPYSKDEKFVGLRMLDNEYRTRGTTDSFLNNCRMKYDKNNVSCMLSAVSLDGMSLCSFAGKE